MSEIHIRYLDGDIDYKIELLKVTAPKVKELDSAIYTLLRSLDEKTKTILQGNSAVTKWFEENSPDVLVALRALGHEIIAGTIKNDSP